MGEFCIIERIRRTVRALPGKVVQALRSSLGYAMGMFLVLIMALLLFPATSAMAAETIVPRPAQWAQPMTVAGVPNLYQVSDTLYRSAQPTAEGMKNLQRMGIRTVVNLRSFHSDRDEIGKTGLAGEHIYMKAWHPEREEIIRFLRIVTDPARTPVLVHCQHGADRTGTMSAMYRIAVQGWTKEAALREMTEGGYGFHAIWKNLPPWIADLDIESVKKEVGLKSATKK